MWRTAVATALTAIPATIHYSTHVEQQQGTACNHRIGMLQQHHVANDQQNADLG